jgi:hypothetical protein
MPEPGITPADAAVPAGTPKAGADQPSAEAPARTNWFFYGLGLSLQTFLWFLLFLALVVAVAVGSELTEFRYVGF